jgi:transposase
MGQPLEITRKDRGAFELRAIAARTRDGDVVRRLLAIALVMDGQTRSAAALACGMDRQILRDWLLRYNESGVAGLSNRPISGRPARLTREQMSELKQIVLDGPDLEKHGVVRWRCVDLQGEISNRFGVSAHVGTIGKWLGQLNLTRLQPRPAHPGKSPEAEAAFKKTSATSCAKPCPSAVLATR